MTKRIEILLFVWLLALATAGCAMGPSAQARQVDTASTRATDQGVFQVSYQSDLEPAQINQLHAWTLHVDNNAGEPVDDATIQVTASMPDHGHGMPTDPVVTEALGGGDYRVEGLKYSMPGWWTLTLEITAQGQTDQVTFNLVLDE
jgi:hypothetical protein